MAETPQLKLYHYWRSSSSWRVRWVLAFKNISASYIPINLLENEQNSNDYKTRSPTAFVPALEADGRVLTESVAIAEYLEQLFPEPSIFPSDPWLKARTRQLVEEVNAGTQPLQNLHVLRSLWTTEAERTSWAQKVIERGLSGIEKTLSLVRQEGVQGPFALGDNITLADMFLVPQLYNAKRFAVDMSPYPLARAAEQAALEHPSGKASHPDNFKP